MKELGMARIKLVGVKLTFDEKLKLWRASVGCGWGERWAYGDTPEKAKRALRKALRDNPAVLC